MNVTVALVTPIAGSVCVPLRYCHCTGIPFASYKPTQSPGVPGAVAIVAVTIPPAVPVVAPSVMLGAVVVMVFERPAQVEAATIAAPSELTLEQAQLRNNG